MSFNPVIHSNLNLLGLNTKNLNQSNQLFIAHENTLFITKIKMEEIETFLKIAQYKDTIDISAGDNNNHSNTDSNNKSSSGTATTDETSSSPSADGSGENGEHCNADPAAAAAAAAVEIKSMASTSPTSVMSKNSYSIEDTLRSIDVSKVVLKKSKSKDKEYSSPQSSPSKIKSKSAAEIAVVASAPVVEESDILTDAFETITDIATELFNTSSSSSNSNNGTDGNANIAENENTDMNMNTNTCDSASEDDDINHNNNVTKENKGPNANNHSPSNNLAAVAMAVNDDAPFDEGRTPTCSNRKFNKGKPRNRDRTNTINDDDDSVNSILRNEANKSKSKNRKKKNKSTSNSTSNSDSNLINECGVFDAMTKPITDAMYTSQQMLLDALSAAARGPAALIYDDYDDDDDYDSYDSESSYENDSESEYDSPSSVSDDDSDYDKYKYNSSTRRGRGRDAIGGVVQSQTKRDSHQRQQHQQHQQQKYNISKKKHSVREDDSNNNRPHQHHHDHHQQHHDQHESNPLDDDHVHNNDLTKNNDNNDNNTSNNKTSTGLKHFLHDITSEGIYLRWHKPVRSSAEGSKIGIGVKVSIQISDADSGVSTSNCSGAIGGISSAANYSHNQNFVEPNLVWEVVTDQNNTTTNNNNNNNSKSRHRYQDIKTVRERLSLFDISSVQKAADSLNLHSFPHANGNNSILITLQSGQLYTFEAEDEAEAKLVVHGLRWISARLIFNLLTGNRNVCSEMLPMAHSYPGSDSLRDSVSCRVFSSSLMLDVTDRLVDKSLARLRERSKVERKKLHF